MLPLASWIMQGRGHALGFVLIALTLSPVIWPSSILAAAALGLVFLRIGTRDGALLWLWTLLPAAALAFYLDSFMPLLLISSVGLASWVLKKTASWPYSLMCLSASSLLAALCLQELATESLTPYVAEFNRILADMQQQLLNTELKDILPDSVEATFVAGLFGSILIVGAFCSLMLARSWQAKLYNPGGFQKEFHQLQLGKTETLGLTLIMILFYFLGAQYITWVWLVLFPLLIAGIALFHAYARHKRMAMHWYFIFYIALMFWDPVKILLAGLALADSYINFRSRFPKTTTDQDS